MTRESGVEDNRAEEDQEEAVGTRWNDSKIEL